jgi:hypothetical protein
MKASFQQVVLRSSVMSTEPTRPEDLASLYRRAFAEYGVRALWNMRPVEQPTPADALAITKALRTHGGTAACRADRELCRAHQ